MKKAGDLVRQIMDNISDSEKYVGIFKKWSDLVGSEFAAHANIKDIEQGYIVVEVDHPGWMQKFQLMERKILKKVQKYYTELEIKGIKLFLKTIDNAK